MLLGSIGLHDIAYKISFVAIKTIAAISVVMLVYRSVDVFTEYLEFKANKTSNKLDNQLVPLVRRALKITTVLLGAIFVLQNLNVRCYIFIGRCYYWWFWFCFCSKRYGL